MALGLRLVGKPYGRIGQVPRYVAAHIAGCIAADTKLDVLGAFDWPNGHTDVEFEQPWCRKSLCREPGIAIKIRRRQPRIGRRNAVSDIGATINAGLEILAVAAD